LCRLVVGQMERPWRLCYGTHVDLIGIRIKPSASRLVLGTAPAALTNRIAPLADVAPALDALFANGAAGRPIHRVKILRAMLRSHLAILQAPDAVVSGSIDAIRRAHGSVRLTEIAGRLGTTVRQIERAFRRDVGLSPKRWARIVRFQSAWTAGFEADAPPLAELAQRLGYADQAHLSREFLEFAGVSAAAARTGRR